MALKRSGIKRGLSVLTRSELKRTRGLRRGGDLTRAAGLARTGPPKAKPKRYTDEEREPRARWNALVPRGMHGHHCLRRKTIERLAADAGLPVAVIAWDTAWMAVVSPEQHERHHNRSARLPLSIVPLSARRAAEFLDDALERVGKPRTAALQLRQEYEPWRGGGTMTRRPTGG